MSESAANHTMSHQLKTDHYYFQNVIGISGVEFLWGFGLPVVVESTFLQLFLKSLGASSLAIGMIPAFFFIGISIFALFSSYLTSGMVFKRKAVILLHLVSAFSLLLFGGILFVFGRIHYLLLVFFITYAVFSICIGMVLPVWLNYLVKILPEEKSVAGLSFMMIAQNIAKLTSSLFLVKIVDKYAFSIHSSGLIFITVGVLFILGSLFFFFTKELNDVNDQKKHHTGSFVQYIVEAVRHIYQNKNFLFFLASDLEFFIVVTVISFYANYATGYCGIDPAVAAGIFVGCIYAGAITTNFLMGTLGYLGLRYKYILSKGLAISAICLMIMLSFEWSFILASYLLGASRGIRMLVYAPAIKKLSGLADSTSYFAVAPVLTLPFAAGLPLVYGKFLDHTPYLGAESYRIIFAVSVLLITGTLYCILKTDFSGP